MKIMEKTMNVNDFACKYVPLENRKKWWELMKEWDGSEDVRNAFYTMDVLIIKLDEARE
jgi:hypothetical protein